MSALTMRYFFEFKELITPQIKRAMKSKFVEKMQMWALFTLWLIAFTYTVYEMATKGIW